MSSSDGIFWVMLIIFCATSLVNDCHKIDRKGEKLRTKAFEKSQERVIDTIKERCPVTPTTPKK